MRAGPNSYSHRWFELFHTGIDEGRTIQETMFVCGCAPLPGFRRAVDVCCGMGRHARALSRRGYAVVGIDRDSGALAKARELAGGPDYLLADIRDYRPEPGGFDLTIVMSQSFGYFDTTTNRDLLARLAAGVREGGRIILDLWNPEFFAAHQSERELQTSGGRVRENKRLEGDRLFVELEYPGGDREHLNGSCFRRRK